MVNMPQRAPLMGLPYPPLSGNIGAWRPSYTARRDAMSSVSLIGRSLAALVAAAPAGRARAAGGADAAHRPTVVLCRERCRGATLHRKIRGGAGAIGLGAWPQRADRLSLGRGRPRPLSALRYRARGTQTGPDCWSEH